MILPKIAQAIRRQDWFQVTVEILIVVIGIFLGLQVTEWSDQRKERIEEQLYISRLHSDMAGELHNLNLRIEYLSTALHENGVARTYLGDPKNSDISPSRLIVSLYASTLIYPYEPYSVTYEELKSVPRQSL